MDWPCLRTELSETSIFSQHRSQCWAPLNRRNWVLWVVVQRAAPRPSQFSSTPAVLWISRMACRAARIAPRIFRLYRTHPHTNQTTSCVSHYLALHEVFVFPWATRQAQDLCLPLYGISHTHGPLMYDICPVSSPFQTSGSKSPHPTSRL